MVQVHILSRIRIHSILVEFLETLDCTDDSRKDETCLQLKMKKLSSGPPCFIIDCIKRSVYTSLKVVGMEGGHFLVLVQFFSIFSRVDFLVT